MANVKISALSALGTTPAGTDIIPITDNSGTPTTKKVTVTNLMGAAPVQSVAGRTGAVTIANTDVSGLGTASTQDVGTANGNVVQLDATGLPAVDGSQLTNVSGTDSTKLAIANDLNDLNDAATARTNLGLGTAATTASTDYATAAQGSTADSAVQPTDSINALADVDTSTVAPVIDDLLKWDGTNFVPGTSSVDVDGPLTTALRGTENPHIGAYPNQSFKVVDNPYQSVMVVADEAGNLKLLNSLGVNNIAVGFSVVEDSTEPDIEVVSGSETYSVISGDSDSKGANGLPIRQGFNLPDIGAFPAPILISGGTIA